MLEKLLNTGVKIAAFGVTAPATVAVVDSLFASYPPAIRAVIVACGVALIEGVFLLSWIAVDQRKNDAPEMKVRPVVSVWVMFGALLAIGFAHGEGLAALPLRLALGLALAGATYDTMVYGWSKATAKADRDISTTVKVRREARKQAQAVAIEGLRSSARLELLTLRNHETLETERLQKSAAVDSRRISQEHRHELQKYSETESAGGLRNGNHRYPIDRARSARKVQKSQRLEYLAGLVAANPGVPTSVLVERYQEKTGVSESTAYSDLSELKAAPISSNGNGNGRH